MKKSLFSKLVVIYFIIMIISYSTLVMTLSLWFYNYYYQNKKNAILKDGEYIQRIVRDYTNGKINKTDMHMQISVIEKLLDYKVTVYDFQGFEVRFEKENRTIKDEDLLEVIKGRSVDRREGVGDRNKYKMTIGIPIKISETVTYAVFIQAPFEEEKESLKNIYITIWVVSLLIVVLSTFIIYYALKRILIKPLSKINDIIKQISKGNFDKRLDIFSDDEIGDLAVSFNYMTDSIENLEYMRRSFIANVSHELRSPMTSINGFVDGMLDGTIPKDKWEKYLKVVNGESKRLIRITNELLDLARLEAGEFSMQIGKFDINDLISECIIKFEDRIYQKNIEMNVRLVKNGIIVKGDRDRINQVLTNILDNAIKFVPEGGNIEVKAIPKDDIVLVSVFNTGDPIPKEDIKLIWERFHKVDKARKRTQTGVGIGLSISRQILNQHNQNIWVESSTNGNTFTFTISIFE